MPLKTAAEKDAENQLAIKDADITLARAKRIMDQLGNAKANLISIATRHANELVLFIQVYCEELSKYRSQLLGSGSDIDRQLLMTRHMELEQAVRFVERAFLEPRAIGTESRVLEAADWMCVDGFQLFIQDAIQSPIGPIVAIDSAMTPAVWSPDANLPIPSLFQTQPGRIDREKKLAYFPVICLPGQMARSPEYFPLLSHEVGHAVDYYIGLSSKILEEARTSPRLKYWTAWMREIVADAVGLTLSGEAFIVALHRYLNLLSPMVEISTSNAYPANSLRLALLGCLLKHYPPSASGVERLIPSDVQVREINQTALALLQEFRDRVAPIIVQHILNKNSGWIEERATIEKIVGKLLSDTEVPWPKAPFRLMPSVIAMAQFNDKSNRPVGFFPELFQSMQNSVPDKDKPAWVEGKTTWTFKEELLPSLRPTLLGTDGKFKVPPLILMTTHQRIAFVGATNWQLHEKLKEAFAARNGQPWDELHIFFATDLLLRQVKYDDKSNPISDRDQSRKQLCTELTDGKWAKKWFLYDFNGPPVFASYWDWETKGGRIHISPALLGTVIGECPAADHIWYHDAPTDQYEKYVKHLNVLLRIIPGTTLKSTGSIA